MNKFFVLAAGLFLLSFQLVSAAVFSDLRQSVEQFVTEAPGVLAPIFEVIIGDYATSEFFFAKVLLLFILLAFVGYALGKVPAFEKNRAVKLIITIAVSILAVRFISENQLVTGILLPYGVLGIVITTAVPFFIIFWFLHTANIGSLGRRLTWIFFGIVFLVLWFNRYDKISTIGNQIYLGGALLVVLAFFFDRGIHRYFKTYEMNIFLRKASSKTVAALQAEYLAIVNVDTPEAKQRRADIENQLRSLGAYLP